MDKLDQMIAEALAQEDQDILAETGERSFFSEFLGQFSGRNAWVNWLTTFMIFVYVGLTVWCGYEFFTATEPLAAIKWGFGASVSIIVIGMLKLYLFGEMQANRMIREMKRIELMLAARND